MCEQQPIVILAEPDQREAKQRRCRNIEPLGAILSKDLLQTLPRATRRPAPTDRCCATAPAQPAQ